MMDKSDIQLETKYLLRWIPDKAYVKLYFRLNQKRKLNDKNVLISLCFIKITKKAKIKLYVLPGVGIYKRKSLI